MYKVRYNNGDWAAFPLTADVEYDCLVDKLVWEENCQNNDNKIALMPDPATNGQTAISTFVPNHIPDRIYWMNGKEYTLKHPDTLPEGASFEKPSDVSAQEERALRDDLLRQSDWAVLPDAPLTAEQKQEWQAYRQALRDIPQQSGFPEFVIVPEAPKKVVG